MKCKLSFLLNRLNKWIFIPNSRKELFYILKEFLHLTEKDFIIDNEIDISYTKIKELISILKRRNQREPFSYIFQKKEFCSLDFKINHNVLIPRPETEDLVEITIQEIRKWNSNSLIGMDVGTGSGCIAISLIYYCDQIQLIHALDINPKAIELAKENASNILKQKIHRLKFFNIDLINQEYNYKEFFHFIVSNPPYILYEEYKKLKPEIFFEPYTALVVEKPLYFFYKFFKKCYELLKNQGKLFLETSPSLVFLQTKILTKIGFQKIKILKDYNHLERYLIVEKPQVVPTLELSP